MSKLYRQMARFILAVAVLVAGATVSFSQAADGDTNQVVGTIVRFSAGTTSVDLSIGENNPTVRDFLSLLPLTMKLEEYAGREKIGYFPRKLVTEGSPGSDPEDGELIYFAPWGQPRFLLQHRRHRLFEPDDPHRQIQSLTEAARTTRGAIRQGRARPVDGSENHHNQD